MTVVLETVDGTEVREGVDRETIETVQAMAGKYKYGWETDIEMDYAPKGLNEDIVRLISQKNGEPEWLLDWRLALDMARVLSSQTTVIDLSSPWGAGGNPWNGLLVGPQAPARGQVARRHQALSNSQATFTEYSFQNRRNVKYAPPPQVRGVRRRRGRPR